MSFPQFPNGDQICTIPIHYKENNNGEGNQLVYDLFIGWQLHQISDDKGKHRVHTFYRRCLGAVACTNCGTLSRPKSLTKRINDQVTHNCTSCSATSTLEHIPCDCRITFYIGKMKGNVIIKKSYVLEL